MKNVFAIHKTECQSAYFLKRICNDPMEADQKAGALCMDMLFLGQQVGPEFAFMLKQVIEVFFLECFS